MALDLFDNWVEIFRTGSHTTSDGRVTYWGEDDLDQVVRNYDPNKHEAPIVIGHPKTNDPAYGWVEALKRVGSTLLAKFKQVDSGFAEKVKAGRYKKRSVSISPGNHLNHVGFLGAVAPAVSGLADFGSDNCLPTFEFATTDEGNLSESHGTTEWHDDEDLFSLMSDLHKYV